MLVIFKGAAVVGLIAGYALLSHFALTLPNGQVIAVALAAGVPALALVGLVFQSLQRHRWLAAVVRHRSVQISIAVLLATVPALLLLWFVWPALLTNAQNLYFAQHVGTNALLAGIFGRTLLAGSTPLVVNFARIVHPVLPPEIEAYARKVTVAWTAFFLVTCVVSVVLFFSASVSMWSAFAVLFQWPSVGIFFVGEYLLRKKLFRHFDHASLKQGFEAYKQHQAHTPPAATTTP